MQELILDEQLLSGTTLTAVTLPDGTQAFMANNSNNDGQGDIGLDRNMYKMLFLSIWNAQL